MHSAYTLMTLMTGSHELMLSLRSYAARAIPVAAALVLLLGLAVQAPVQAQAPTADELRHWEKIKTSKKASDYEAFLKDFPDGALSALARARADYYAKGVGGAGSSGGTGGTGGSGATGGTPPTAGGKEFRDCDVCPVMVSLPGGTFSMGSAKGGRDEKPAHSVAVPGFSIGKYEVTVAEWAACKADGGCRFGPPKADAKTPVRNISWLDAKQYAAWLAKKTGKAYRLPSEAEWEYAARAGTETRYWWGDAPGEGRANCKDCGGVWDKKAPANAGALAANAFGLHDTAGGVWEWVADCFHPSFDGAPADGSVWDRKDCRKRVLRGGSWRDDAGYLRSAARNSYDFAVAYSRNGLRVARGN